MTNGEFRRKAAFRYTGWIILVVACVVIIWWWVCSPVTTVLLVRHAERAASPAGDPPLSVAGQARAQDLVHVAGVAGVTGVYASQFQRTQQTVLPLATALGLMANVVDAGDVEELLDQLVSNNRGSVALVAGHSNTVPEIVERLGAGVLCPEMFAFSATGDCLIPDGQFDNFFVVTVRRYWTGKVVRLRYGQPTP